VNIVGIVQPVHAVDLVVVFMKPVILQFIGDIDQDEKEAGNTNGQANDIQNGVIEMLQNVSDGNDH
jgi:hypothetical protein